MTGSVESVSSSSARVLVIAPNWLGDGIMAMPGIQVLRENLGADASITVAARGAQTVLWNLHPDVTDVRSLPKGFLNTRTMAASLKDAFDGAVVLPNSFRSALLPKLAGIPRRRGTCEQMGRGFLINETVEVSDLQEMHQQWESARILVDGNLPEVLPAPTLKVPESITGDLKETLASLPRPWLSLIPGAARGPSKQWPAERFQAVAQQWIDQTGGGALWLGTPEDGSLCHLLNTTLGEHGTVLAGTTTLEQFAGAIALSDVVAANDSGGMHLAAALGTPVAAVFGITDPSRTGPLSPLATVLQHSDQRSRSVPADSPEARAALAAVSVEEVAEAVLAFPRPADKGR